MRWLPAVIALAAALGAVGVKAVPSYTVLPQDGPVAEESLHRAVTQAGVSHALVTRVINVSTPSGKACTRHFPGTEKRPYADIGMRYSGRFLAAFR